MSAPLAALNETGPSTLATRALMTSLVSCVPPCLPPSHPPSHPDDWRWSIVLNGVPGLVMLLCLPFVPESPNWLVSKGRDEAATKVSAGPCLRHTKLCEATTHTPTPLHRHCVLPQALQRLRPRGSDVTHDMAALQATLRPPHESEKGAPPEPQKHPSARKPQHCC